MKAFPNGRGRQLLRLAAIGAVLAAVLAVGPPSVSVAARSGPTASSPRSTPPPIVLVQFKNPASAAAKVRAAGDRVLGTVGGRVHIVRLKAGQSAAARAAVYDKRPDVVYAEPARRLKVDLAAPDDPYGSAWWLNAIHALQGWSIYPNSYSAPAGVKIAIGDTGIDPTHPDLDGKIDVADGANCIHDDYSGVCTPWGTHYSGDFDPSFGLTPIDDYGHGTHVAGIAGAEANNATGVAGVALNSPLIPLKIIDFTGSGFDFEIASGILWAKNHGASVLNLSLGLAGTSTTLCNAVSQAVSAGVVVVAASGNNNTSAISTPAGCPGAIGVAATTISDSKASFSNFGYPNTFVSAPGEEIYSTIPVDFGSYETHSGTSMAAPFVTGLVALLRSQQTMSVAEVKHVLARTSDKVGGVVYGTDPFHTCSVCKWNASFGYGRINVENALHGILPAITTFTPTSASVGGLVTINGDALGAASAVGFTGAAPVTPTILSPTSIRAAVPADALAGPISVTTPTGTATSAGIFKPLPQFTFPATPFQAGETAVLTGSNLGGVTAVKIGLLSLPSGPTGFTAVSPEEIDVFIPDAAVTGLVAVTTPAGTKTSATPLKIRPTISSLSTDHGPAGTLVTLTGKTFTGTTAVKFNGVVAVFSILSPTSLRATVPNAATTGKVSVTNAGGITESGSDFTVEPKVTGFTPASAIAGANVTLAGSGLAGATNVSFKSGAGTTTATIVSNTATSVVATVPNDATTGQITVTTPFGTAATSATILFKPLPKITTFTPQDGTAGTEVTLTGTNLLDVSVVKFGVLVAGFVVDSATQVRATVPVGFATGAVSVTTPAGTAVSATQFQVTKVIGFTPVSASGGATITITGVGLGSVTSVDFVGHAGVAPALVPTATAVKVVVPVDAKKGVLKVNTPRVTGAASVALFSPLPKLLSLAPADGAVGQEVTLTGTNLLDASVVKFGVLVAGFVVDSATQVRATVPVGFATGAVSVTTPAGTAVSATQFQVTKVIGFTPVSASGGATITITGVGLGSVTSVDFVGHAGVAPALVPTATAVKVVVPVDAKKGVLKVNTPRVTGAASVALFSPLPKLLSLAPADGAVGQEVTLTGTNLLDASVVKFGVLVAGFVVDSATQVRATVPVGFATGAVSVTTPAGTAVSATQFQVTKVVGFTPVSASGGATITITGVGLGSVTSVDFVGHAGVAPALAPTATAVKVVVPVDAKKGVLKVNTPRVTGAASVALFSPLPKLLSLAPADGAVGQEVTLTGTNLLDASVVKFGVLVAGFVVDSATQVRATVPVGFATGAVSVTTPAGTAVSATQFQVTKVIGFTPPSAPFNTVITITGTGLASATGVDFPGHSGAVAIDSATPTAVKVKVPNDATLGQLTVHTPRATATTPVASPFKALPRITIDASSHHVGDIVSIAGTNLTDTTVVKVGALTLSPGNWSILDATHLEITIPDSALTGAVSVTTAQGAVIEGTTTSSTPLKIAPTINALDGTNDHGKSGDHIVLGGKTFTGTTSVTFASSTATRVPAAFVVGAGGLSLNVTVPGGTAVSGAIRVTNSGGPTDSTSFTVEPKITSFTPTTGPTGTVVTVAGSGFGGADRVDFAGGVSGVPTNVTPASLKVIVPAGATSGQIKVHTPEGGDSPVSAAAFTITFSVTSISPTVGGFNQQITVTGVNLTGVTEVRFNGVPRVGVTDNTGTTLHVMTPSSGDISGPVTVWKGLVSVLAPQQFTRFDVTGFTPTSGVPGTPVTISGHGFTGATHVSFNGVDAGFTVDSATSITAQVPEGATNGAITVELLGGATSSSADSFTVTTPATLQLTEVNPNLSSDLVELKVLTGGSLSGIQLRQAPSSGALTLATLPAVTVAAGDLVVVHLTPPEGVTTETGNIGQCPDTACYSGAWDVAGGSTGITYSNQVLTVSSASGTVEDGAPFVQSSPGTTSAEFRTDLGFLQLLEQWLPVDCTGQPCTDLTTPSALGISVNWDGVGALDSVGRSGDPDTNQAADWAVAAQSFGQANP